MTYTCDWAQLFSSSPMILKWRIGPPGPCRSVTAASSRITADDVVASFELAIFAPSPAPVDIDAGRYCAWGCRIRRDVHGEPVDRQCLRHHGRSDRRFDTAAGRRG